LPLKKIHHGYSLTFPLRKYRKSAIPTIYVGMNHLEQNDFFTSFEVSEKTKMFKAGFFEVK